MLFIYDLGVVPHCRSCVSCNMAKLLSGLTEDIFSNPQHSYTQHLLAAEPKGAPPKTDDRRLLLCPAKI